MKKIVLIAFSLLFIISAKDSVAQTFSIPKDTVKYAVQNLGYAEDVLSYIKNETSAPIKLNWKIVSHNMPASWTSSFGLCDNVLCYGSTIVGTPGPSQLTDTFSTTCPFKISMAFNNAVHGVYYVTSAITDGTFTDSVTFLIEKFPTNVNAVRTSADGISMYPNPAQDELNVLFSSNAGIRNITVYNLIGKAMTVYKVTSNTSAKLNIQNIPSGIYFIRLTDAHGHVVATRKFTRQ